MPGAEDAMSRQLPPGLPSSIDELIRAIEEATAREAVGPVTYEVADALRSLRSCDVCGRPVVGLAVLVERLAERYGATEHQAHQLREALGRSPLETGDVLSPNYCSFHAQITSE